MSIEILTVAYRAQLSDLQATADTLVQAQAEGVPLSWGIWHNDDEQGVPADLQALYDRARAQGLTVRVSGGRGNLGFGGGVNALLEDTPARFVLLLNQDAILEPGALKRLWHVADTDEAQVAAWEMRQIPFEHPKAYDPVTLDTIWVSGAAVLLRTDAMRAVKGFEPRIFMYGEDVDLSWRLRCAGWRVRYIPQCAVVHHTYSRPDEVKPLQALEGIYVNLCLRARYSGRKRVLQGLSMAVAEMMLPQSFEGRRKGIARAIWRFVRNYGYFRRSHQSAPGFEPCFNGWGYEPRREGAFHPFQSQAEQAAQAKPLVSILIRTHHRPAFLRQALQSVAHQTWANVEAVVVEDGSDDGEAVCAEFADRLSVRYVRLHPAQGRSVAGNRALSEARGEWLCFLDDDDLLFADHVEVLMQTVQQHQVKGAYALAWRVFTRVENKDTAQYEERHWDVFPDEPFSRPAMWHHNYMPIQSVLFHRSLFEQHGGFAEDMDQLEDWNLWTRYTMNNDFVQLRKVTSKYRVPEKVDHNAERQRKLDEAYQDAVARQRALTFEANPVIVREMAEVYVRSNALLHVSRDQLRDQMARRPWFAKLMALRGVLRRRLGR